MLLGSYFTKVVFREESDHSWVNVGPIMGGYVEEGGKKNVKCQPGLKEWTLIHELRLKLSSRISLCDA